MAKSLAAALVVSTVAALTLTACSPAMDPGETSPPASSSAPASGSPAASGTVSAEPTGDADGWKEVLSTDFEDNTLGALWAPRNSGSYLAGGRQCSAPAESNIEVKNDKVRLSVSKETSAANIAKAKKAGCKEAGVYRNGMVSTQNVFSLKQGKVAARIKFPMAQGMHGGVWLQSGLMAEIDIVESYGYGKGLTSVVHVDGQRTPKAGKDTYVLKDAVKDPEWWSEYHVYSAEWNDDEVIFRIDDQETQRLQVAMPDTDYFLVLSNLNSDWEQDRLTAPKGADDVKPAKLPVAMSVDWVRAWVPA